MSTGQKVAIGVLVLLTLCFVVAVILPGRITGTGRPDDDQLAPFRALLQNPAAVEPGDLSATCLLQGDRLIFTGDCTLTVDPSDAPLRLLRLRPDKEIEIEAPAPQTDDFTIEAELEPKQEIQIAIDNSGAKIELDCDAGNCTVQVL